MKIRKNILSDLKPTMDGALELLNNKYVAINGKMQELQKREKQLTGGKTENGEYSESNKAVLSGLINELLAEEMNERDIMDEKIYLNALIKGLRQALGKDDGSYGGADSRIRLGLNDLESSVKTWEIRLKAISGETQEKSVLRNKIVTAEKQIKVLKKDGEQLGKDFEPLLSQVSNRSKALKDELNAQEALVILLDKAEEELAQAGETYTSTHKNFVDNRRVLSFASKNVDDIAKANELFGTVQLALLDAGDDLDGLKKIVNDNAQAQEDSSKEYKEAEQKVLNLKRDVEKHNQRALIIEEEIQWLNTSQSIDNINITSVKDKLSTWKVNYGDFQGLVNELVTQSGYKRTSSFDGSDAEVQEGQNPLIALIEEVQRINEWLSVQPDVLPASHIHETTTQTTTSEGVGISPYLLGVVALGTIMLLKK